jgi:hypothetical protein
LLLLLLLLVLLVLLLVPWGARAPYECRGRADASPDGVLSDSSNSGQVSTWTHQHICSWPLRRLNEMT